MVGRKEGSPGSDHYLLVCCSPLAGLEQHLISQAVGADEELQMDMAERLDLSFPLKCFFNTEFCSRPNTL